MMIAARAPAPRGGFVEGVVGIPSVEVGGVVGILSVETGDSELAVEVITVSGTIMKWNCNYYT